MAKSASSETPRVERGVPQDFAEVRWLFDTYSTGVYGFVPDSRIRRHLREGAVYVVRIQGDIAAAAIGKPGETLWNIMVKPEFRHLHLGTLLLEAVDPQVIRVKCRAHKGMSKAKQEQFTDPTPFYERMGYVFQSWDYPKNFYRGKDPRTGKGKVVRVGDARNVKIMRKLQPGEKAPEPDQTAAPRVTPVTSAGFGLSPKVKQHCEGESQIPWAKCCRNLRA